MRTLAHALRRQGHLTEPLRLLEDAQVHYEASGDRVGQWQTLRFIGQTYLDLGEHEKARGALEQAETVADELGRERLIAQTRYWKGQACLAMNDIAGARAAFDAVFEVYRDDPGVGHAYALHGMGDVAWRTGAHDAADRDLAAAISLAMEGADAVLEGRIWLSIAGLRKAQGQREAQEAALHQAVTVFAGSGAARLQARALSLLAQVMADRDDDAGAEIFWVQLDDLYRSMDIPWQDRIHRPVAARE